MPLYSPTTWVNGVTALSAAAMNNIENGIVAALRADGAVAATGLFTFNRTLSSGNQLMDLQQNYGLYSDNTATTFAGATSRVWLDAPTTGEVHIGPRAGSSALKGLRILALDLNHNNGTTNGKIWSALNDGAGSGLDADLLDGHQPGSGNGLDADLLDGLQATAFPLVGTGGGFGTRTIGVGPIGSRPAAGNKGAVYIETPFS